MTVTRQRLKAPQRRQRILQAAEQEFAARGYHSTSMGEIAAAAGVSKPVLYDHFESKLDLYTQLTEGIRDELTGRGAAAMAGGGPPGERIRTAIDAFFAFVEERPSAARVLLFTPVGEAELVDAARHVQAGATAALTALLVGEPGLFSGNRNRELRLELLTEFMKQGLHGLAEWWSQHPETPREVLVDAVMDLVWTGLSGGYAAP
jgi:AcrR family transcriptional regulator